MRYRPIPRRLHLFLTAISVNCTALLLLRSVEGEGELGHTHIHTRARARTHMYTHHTIHTYLASVRREAQPSTQCSGPIDWGSTHMNKDIYMLHTCKISLIIYAYINIFQS